MSPEPVEPAEAPAGPRSAKDFFLSLIQDSQHRPGFLIERERWLRSVRLAGREERLFELEMLLRGIERYFNLHNLPLDPSQPVMTRDFHPELADLQDALAQAIKLGRSLLDPASDQKMVFRKYVETQLADDRARRELLEDELDQDSPQESLFVLRQSFGSLRTLIDHLLRLDACPYPLFSEVGNLALREIVHNRYFRPFRPLEFRIEYDRIKSVPLLEGLRKLPDPERRLFTVASLALFRLLHYLDYLRPGDQAPPRRTRVVMALVHSESISLVGFLRGGLAPHVGDKRRRAAALKVARELARESERITRQLSSPGEASLADANASYQGLFRAQVVTVSRALLPGLSGEDLFERLVAPRAGAARLRRDLYAFAELCGAAEAAFRGGDPEAGEEALAHLRAFGAYFYDVSYQLLRYGDYEPFDVFTSMIAELRTLPGGAASRARLADDCRLFTEILRTMFTAISRRGELAQHAFSPEEAKAVFARYKPV